MRKIYLAEETISKAELGALAEWLPDAPRLTKGPLCSRFEEKFASWQGAKHAIFVNSGSSANLLMVWSLVELGRLKNKKAIAPAVSWCTTVTPLIQFGFDVSLCECAKDNLGLDVDHFEHLCKTEQPSVAILVHVLGHPCNVEKIKEICRKYDVILLEDSCEALGTVLPSGEKCGSAGLAGSFSFYYGHHISTIEGGMVVTDDEELFNVMLSIRSHGWARDVSQKYHDEWAEQYNIDAIRDLYTFYYSGFNLRSTDVNAFLGLSQLEKIDGYAKIRSDNYFAYKELLGDFWSQTSENRFLSHFAYGVLVKNRVEVFNYLSAHGIECRPLICGNIGRHPFWLKKFAPVHLHMADLVHDFGLYLPNHACLSHDDIKYVCEKFLEKAIPLTI